MRPWHEARVLGSRKRGSHRECQSQYALMCRKAKATPVLRVVAISNCQLSMNLQKHKQTDRQSKGARLLLQLKRLYSPFPSHFPFTIPRSCQYFASSFFRIRVGSSFLFVCWIMQIKWHISMSVAILLLQFSSLTPFQNAINVSIRGGAAWLSIQFKEGK